ncbi:hypothetical protein EVAR_85994_1 [Eumeta japonica]|uniref:Uncharacterized protein n=1 Tax=Eumeta variegata TaxID=151549 RepID=A0A4C1UKJ9_EUMVA|nr:hypothetical protein EVAR_85994_1 [Eumeta japonica]
MFTLSDLSFSLRVFTDFKAEKDYYSFLYHASRQEDLESVALEAAKVLSRLAAEWIDVPTAHYLAAYRDGCIKRKKLESIREKPQIREREATTIVSRIPPKWDHGAV